MECDVDNEIELASDYTLRFFRCGSAVTGRRSESAANVTLDSMSHVVQSRVLLLLFGASNGRSCFWSQRAIRMRGETVIYHDGILRLRLQLVF